MKSTTNPNKVIKAPFTIRDRVPLEYEYPFRMFKSLTLKDGFTYDFEFIYGEEGWEAQVFVDDKPLYEKTLIKPNMRLLSTLKQEVTLYCKEDGLNALDILETVGEDRSI